MPNFNIHWKIPFMSLRSGTLYTVNIYKDGALPSGYPLTLKGAAQPFVTQEDDDEDQFIAIRTQTGYLRIVDDGKAIDSSTPPQTVDFNWKELLPDTDTDRPVTLTHQSGGQTVVDWQGYLQAQTFTGTLYGGVQEREFPVQCPLSALNASNVDDANRALQNFAYVIKQAFDNLPCITIKNYIFQGGQYAQQWLLKLVDWQNLVSITENGVTGAYDNQRIIQDVCSFWGWTCRVYGQNVIFSCTDDTALTKALVLTGGTGGSLETMAGGTPAGTTNTDFLTAISLTGNIFASDSNDDTRVRGYNKAVVNVDVNEIDTDIIKCFPSSIEDEMANNGWYHGGTNIYYTNSLNPIASALLYGASRNNYASFNIARFNQDYRNFSVFDVIRFYKSYNANDVSTPYASLYTIFGHTYPGSEDYAGYIPRSLRLYGSAYIQGERYDDYESNYGTGKKTMFIRVGIGPTIADAYWFNGSNWVGPGTPAAFRVSLGNKDEMMYIKDQTIPGHSSWHSEISLANGQYALYGRVFVEFLGSDDMPESSGERIFDLANFRVEFYGGDLDQDIRGVQTKPGSTEYVDGNQQKISNEWNADLIYASQNNLAIGYGLVINNSDWSFMETAQYGQNTYAHPEQRLATRVANYWASAKRKLRTDLRANVIPSITPQHKVTLDQTPSYPIAISRDWWNDIVQLTLLEA